MALEDAESREVKNQNIVFDSIRNTAEVEVFRREFHRFILITVVSSLEERWNRLKEQYESKHLTQRDFQGDDDRDANEDISNGQQVRLCVDNADIAIRNERHVRVEHARKEELRKKAEPLIELVTGVNTRSPSLEEYMMAVAYTHALNSMCYKRQVGAVIQDENGNVLGVGCNNNPPPLEPCHLQWGECHRDMYKRDLFEDLKANTKCIMCGRPLKDTLSTDYKCECGFDADKYYVRDKALSRCSAPHAEEAAINNTRGNSLKGCTIYTTTFPCFLCVQKIIVSGIKWIVYCEPYPDPDAASLIRDVNEKLKPEEIIRVYPFEGIKARAYFRVFGDWRKKQEMMINEKRRMA